MYIKNFITPKGLEIGLRRPKEEDAQNLLHLAKTILISHPLFTLTTPEEFTLTVEQEKEWIKAHNSPGAFACVAEHQGKLIGMINIEPAKKKKQSHSGEFAMGILPEYTDQNIGKEMLDAMIHWAKTESALEKIILNVVEHNPRAIHLYKRFGFVTEGVFKNDTKQTDASYSTNVRMALFLK